MINVVMPEVFNNYKYLQHILVWILENLIFWLVRPVSWPDSGVLLVGGGLMLVQSVD